MGPLPKRKTSSTRRNKRRSHDKIELTTWLSARMRRIHALTTSAPHCGTYRGREVIAQQDEE